MRKQKKIKHISERGAGVLLHITSLPGPFGIGDLGRAAYDFIDFLASARQRYWQVLPVGPGDPIFACSPYMSLAALAGNPLLISPELLVADGFLAPDDLVAEAEFSEYRVEFEKVIPYKKRLMQKAYQNFQRQLPFVDFDEFSRNQQWLNDYALFMSLREQHEEGSWCDWPRELAAREPAALAQWARKLSDRVNFYKFEQFCFFRQWQQMRAYANRKGIRLIGDIPIYVSLDSVDVWANQDCFCLDQKTRQPTHVAGVPPDYFSATGQRWGNPLYCWKVGGQKNHNLYQWWRTRFNQLKQVVDLVRIDHFRAFESYWQIPVQEKTAINGKWRKGPGRAFFRAMGEVISDLPIIAEDLGLITPAVEALRQELGFPGMKILQFAFDSDQSNLYLPHNYHDSNFVVFTGTHDNNTTMGWFLGNEGSAEGKQRALRYANSDGRNIHWDFIRMAMASVADTAIIPLQDILGFGADCRLNLPGTVAGNWLWRCAARFINEEVATQLRDETCFYGRGCR